MTRIFGWSDDEFDERATELAALIRRAWRAIAQQISAHISGKAAVTMADAGEVLPAWQQVINEKIVAFLEQTYLDAAGIITDNLDVPDDMLIGDDLVEKFVDESRNRLKGIGEDVWDIVREQIKIGIDDGESVSDIAARVRNVTGVSEGRSLTIARTEVHAAHEAGSYDQAMFVDPDGTKEWLSTNDDRTRHTHRAADGQVVRIGEPFRVGSTLLRYPGDPLGDPGEIINCRCSTAYEFSDIINHMPSDETISEPVAAAGGFDATKHPRGKDGRFIKKGSISTLLTKKTLNIHDVIDAVYDMDQKTWDNLTDKQKAIVTNAVDKYPAAGSSTKNAMVNKLTKLNGGTAPSSVATATPTIPKQKSKSNAPNPSDLTDTGTTLGSHGARVFKDKNGDSWLFKAQENFLSALDVAAADLQRAVGRPASDTYVVTLNGKTGSIQKMLSGDPAFPGQNFNVSSLTDKDVRELLSEHVVDWFLGNHDAHAENFIKLPNDKIFGVDKGNALKFFGQDKLTWGWKPNEHKTVYDRLWSAYANGENVNVTTDNIVAMINTAGQLKSIPDDKIREMFRPYAEKAKAAGRLLTAKKNSWGDALAPKTVKSQDVDAFLDALVARKNNLQNDFGELYIAATKKRNEKLGVTAPPVLATPPTVTSTPAATVDMPVTHNSTPTPTVTSTPVPIPTAPTTIAGLKGKPGDPAKITTSLIWGKHPAGTVILESDTGVDRIQWDGKKYQWQSLDADGNWDNQFEMTKKAAYEQLKTDTHWVVPKPASAATTTTSTTPTPPSSSPTPTPSPASMPSPTPTSSPSTTSTTVSTPVTSTSSSPGSGGVPLTYSSEDVISNWAGVDSGAKNAAPGTVIALNANGKYRIVKNNSGNYSVQYYSGNWVTTDTITSGSLEGEMTWYAGTWVVPPKPVGSTPSLTAPSAPSIDVDTPHNVLTAAEKDFFLSEAENGGIVPGEAIELVNGMTYEDYKNLSDTQRANIDTVLGTLALSTPGTYPGGDDAIARWEAFSNKSSSSTTTTSPATAPTIAPTATPLSVTGTVKDDLVPKTSAPLSTDSLLNDMESGNVDFNEVIGVSPDGSAIAYISGLDSNNIVVVTYAKLTGEYDDWVTSGSSAFDSVDEFAFEWGHIDWQAPAVVGGKFNIDDMSVDLPNGQKLSLNPDGVDFIDGGSTSPSVTPTVPATPSPPDSSTYVPNTFITLKQAKDLADLDYKTGDTLAVSPDGKKKLILSEPYSDVYTPAKFQTMVWDDTAGAWVATGSDYNKIYAIKDLMQNKWHIPKSLADKINFPIGSSSTSTGTVDPTPSPSVSAPPTPSVSPMPAASPAPVHISWDTKQAFKSHMKAGNVGYWSKPEKIWDTLKEIQNKYPDPNNPGHSKYTPLDIAKALDSQLKTSKPNPYEEKLIKWAATAKGKSYIGSSASLGTPTAPTAPASTPTGTTVPDLAPENSDKIWTYVMSHAAVGDVIAESTDKYGNKWRITVAGTPTNKYMKVQSQNASSSAWSDFTSIITPNSLKINLKSTSKGKWKLPSTTPTPTSSVPGTADISHISAGDKTKIYQQFKGQSGTYLSSEELSIYQALKKIGELNSLSVAQMLALVDEESAKKVAKPNDKLFEKKITSWLKTPHGAALAAGKPVPVPDTPALQPYIDTTKIPSFEESNKYTYDIIKTKPEAQSWWQGIMSKHGEWTTAQKSGLKTYTGGSYTSINKYLWGDLPTVSDTHAKAIKNAQLGMRPADKPLLLHRGTGFGGVGKAKSHADIEKMVGQTWKSEGFFSTSYGGSAAFGGAALLEIEVPPGTPLALVEHISHYGTEREVLLAAGLNFKIISVTKNGMQSVVRVRVVPSKEDVTV